MSKRKRDEEEAERRLECRRVNIELGLPAESYRSIERATQVPHSTLQRHNHQDRSPEAIHERASHRAHNRLLLPWQEREIAGLVVYRNMHEVDTSSRRIRRHIYKRFHVYVDDDWISEWKKRMFISSRLCVAACKGELTVAIFEEAVKWLSAWRELRDRLDIKPHQIVSIDKIYIKDQPRSTLQLAPIGQFEFFRIYSDYSHLLL